MAEKNEPGSATCPMWPTYCQARRKRRSCSRPRTPRPEFHQIYLLDPEAGWAEKITDSPEVQHYVGGEAFSPDGTRLAFAANSRLPTDMEVWIRDLDSGDVRSVFGEGKYSFPGGWSPDGTKLIALDFRNNSDSTIHLIDLETGEAPEVTPHDEDGLHLPGPWAVDGSGFYFLTDD